MGSVGILELAKVKEDRDWRMNLLHLACLGSGVALLYFIRVALEVTA